MGYCNLSMDYGEAMDNVATQALWQSLSELSAAIDNKEQAHLAQQQHQVAQRAAQQQMWSLQQSINMLQQQVANLAV